MWYRKQGSICVSTYQYIQGEAENPHKRVGGIIKRQSLAF